MISSTHIEQLRVLLNQPRTHQLIYQLTLINIFILLCRPQNDIPFLALLGLPILLSLPGAFISISLFPRIWISGIVPQCMTIMLIIGLCWIPLARNNFWAFQTVRDLAQQYFAYLFPIVIVLPFAKRLRGMAICLSICGAYLGLYGLAHKGQGPGGFLGDENDLCMLLVGLLGLPLFVLKSTKGLLSKLIHLSAIGLLLIGVVSTMSRGGFVGLLALFAFLFWWLPSKIRMLLIASLGIALMLAVAPEKYWVEMKTITNTEESTARGRLDVWKVGVDVWLYPTHFLFGTGFQNTPYHLGDFEPADQAQVARSMSGRAVHSTYVQLVGDLGLSGIILFGAATLSVIFGCNRMASAVRKERRRTRWLLETIDNKNASQEADLKAIIAKAKGELEYMEAFNLGIVGALLSAMIAGAFVSALYYPTLWIFMIVGVSAKQYSNRIVTLLENIRADLSAEMLSESVAEGIAMQ